MAERLARSGVRGLSSFQVRFRLLENGWAPIPILSHDANDKAAGKRPRIEGWEAYAQFGADPPTEADLTTWSRIRRAPGTGIATGNVVAPDLDFLCFPDLAKRAYDITVGICGETPFVRQGQAPKTALVYRAAEPIETIRLKAANGSGDGIDILGDGAQLVAFGIHPDTGEPYRWIAAASPLTATPDDAPAITNAQIQAVLKGIGRFVTLISATANRKHGGGGGGGLGGILRNAAGLVVDGREAWLTQTVFRTAAALHAEGALEADTLASRAWAAFEATTVLADGGWTLRQARRKAEALVRRVTAGRIDLGGHGHGPAGDAPTDVGAGLKPAEPSYPNRRRLLAEAEDAVVEVVGRFFNEHVPTWKQAVLQAGEMGDVMPKPAPVSWGARIETAIGKTAVAIEATAKAVQAGAKIVYAVPTHRLGAELVERFAAAGVTARVYRGYEADDPDSAEHGRGAKMCLDLPALKDAQEAGAGSIKGSVCERKVNGETLRCARFYECGMTSQRQAKPDVWLVPHALLFSQRPDYIPQPDALVIDEGFIAGAIPEKADRFPLDAIEASDLTLRRGSALAMEDMNDLEVCRANLLRALRVHEDGPVRRQLLDEYGVTLEAAERAYKLEWQRYRDPNITPGMNRAARKLAVQQTGEHNQEVKRWAGVWKEVRRFLEGGAAASGRLLIRYDRKTESRSLERRSLRTIRTSWQAPALLLDATLPPAALLEPVLGHPVEIHANVAAEWSPHVTVRQLIGAPVSASKLGIVEGRDGENEKRSVGEIMRLIRFQAALVGPERFIAVMGQKALIEKLRAMGLPANVEAGHFGAVAGLDRWKDAAGMICIGRPLPDPWNMEMAAGVITGAPPVPAVSENGRTVWYKRITGGIRLASATRRPVPGEGVAGDARAVPVEHVRHPDPIAEALRWQACEGSVLQAIGRLRALRRTEPCFLDIVSDVPLPIVVDEAVPWKAACPGRWADMCPAGVLLTTPEHVLLAFPELAPTPKVAHLVAATQALFPISKFSIGKRACVRAVTYKRRGRDGRRGRLAQQSL